ncbi:polysaccharide pyruvyl transferase CsaB [Synechocystis sp. LKSZ1]|uniref:polysaccharide pyruvyl transferase CsaB n=1 Tax=Synechocystis sp. LKSZ1 TaxID=3144951 RepID=UPI00336C2567
MRAMICGYYGQGNGGDEALLVTLLQMLPANVTPVVLSANPALTQERYGVEACPARAWPEIWQQLRRADLFIWGGGSLMQDATSWTSPLYYAGLMALAQSLGLQTLAWGQGIGPLRRPWTCWLTRWVLGRCSEVSVRDQASAALLKQWHIPALLAPDPVWALQAKPGDGSLALPENRVAVNLRRHPSLTPERLQCLGEALRDFQNATQAHICLVPFQKSQDWAMAEALTRHLPGNYQIVYREDPRELMALFQGVRLTIGMRLHSLIMAAAMGSPCFALSYDPKVKQLMQDVGLPGWELQTLPTDALVISETWQAYFQDNQALSQEERQNLRQQATEHRTLLTRLCAN